MKKPVKNTKSATSQAIVLRRRAEKIARGGTDQSPKKQEALSPEKTLRIFHELQAHQIELQMQNEEMGRLQAELDAARTRYFDLYDLAPIGYCTVNEKGLFMDVNLTASTMLGISRDKLVKQLLTRFILKEDQDVYYLHLKKLFDTGEPQTCELRMVKKDGTVFWAHLTGAAAKDDSGATLCSIVMSDITGRKQMDAQRAEAIDALRKSETQLRATLEAVADGILAVDNKGKVVLANRRFADLWRIPQSLIDSGNDRALLDFVLSQLTDPDSFLKKIQSLYDSDAEDIDKITFKDGRFFERYSLPMIMDGIRIGRVWSFRDITDRKQTEKKLINSEEKFRMLAESSAFAIMMHQGDHWIYANRAAEEISGYTEEELCGMHFWEIVHPDYRDMVKQSGYNRQQGKVMPRAYEFKIIEKNGVEKWVSLTGNPIQYEDKPTALISVIDITEQKITEAALKESEQRYRDMSIIDDLTQLYNSRHFYVQLEREIERSNRYGQPLTLLLLDLDRFKDFNDAYGHVQGDYVLSRLGHAIKRSLRETDSAYRYGGEEFTIILPMTVSEEGIVTSKRIQREFRKENFSLIAGQEVYMTVSIGLAQYKPNEEIKAFVHRVDQFMYKVKKTGRGKICSDDGDLQ